MTNITPDVLLDKYKYIGHTGSKCDSTCVQIHMAYTQCQFQFKEETTVESELS